MFDRHGGESDVDDNVKSSGDGGEQEDCRRVTSEAHFYQQNCTHVAGTSVVNCAKEHDEQEGVLYVSTFTVYVPTSVEGGVSGSLANDRSETKGGRKRTSKNNNKHTIRVYHEALTSIARVGLQVWRGAFLLADYIIHHRHSVQSKTVFEFGCGTGILGIILEHCGLFCGAFITDYSDEIVALAARNINEGCLPRDSLLSGSTGHSGDIKARVLDWASDDNPRVALPPKQGSNDFMTVWTAEDVSRLSSADTEVLFLAADVIYDDELTRKLFLKASQIMKPGECMWLALEKRYNFSLEDNALVANGYKLFQDHVHAQPKQCYTKMAGRPLMSEFVYESPFHGGGKVLFKGSKIPINFPQRLYDYDRIQDLELWEIELQTW